MNWLLLHRWCWLLLLIGSGLRADEAPKPLSLPETIGLALAPGEPAPAPGVWRLAQPEALPAIRQLLLDDPPAPGVGRLLGLLAGPDELAPWQAMLADRPGGARQSAILAALAGLVARQVPGADAALAPWWLHAETEALLAQAWAIWQAVPVAPSLAQRQAWHQSGQAWLANQAQDRLALMRAKPLAKNGPLAKDDPATEAQDRSLNPPPLGVAGQTRSWYWDDGFGLRATGAEITTGRFTLGVTLGYFYDWRDTRYYPRNSWNDDDEWTNRGVYGIWRLGAD